MSTPTATTKPKRQGGGHTVSAALDQHIERGEQEARQRAASPQQPAAEASTDTAETVSVIEKRVTDAMSARVTKIAAKIEELDQALLGTIAELEQVKGQFHVAQAAARKLQTELDELKARPTGPVQLPSIASLVM